MTAAELAKTLDPQHEVAGWWIKRCPECRTISPHVYHLSGCSKPALRDMNHTYVGPPDLHTARQHAWRMEVWLEARGYSVWMQMRQESIRYTVVHSDRPTRDAYVRHTNHSAALAQAVETITKGNKE